MYNLASDEPRPARSAGTPHNGDDLLDHRWKVSLAYILENATMQRQSLYAILQAEIDAEGNLVCRLYHTST